LILLTILLRIVLKEKYGWVHQEIISDYDHALEQTLEVHAANPLLMCAPESILGRDFTQSIVSR
jgi:hypothetical protein